MHNDTAIVVQGPIYLNTKTILDFYNNFGCTLILSTYKNSVNFDISNLKNFHIIENETLSVPGIGNRNMQRTSSFYGIKKAKELGLQYSLKCRTDHFFKNPNTINILKLNIKSFPITIENANQENRIIVPNGGTTLNKNWGTPHISDHWYFGSTNDLLEYFHIDNPHWDKNKPWNFENEMSAEAEFCRLWAKKQNINLPNSMSSLLRDRFIVLDNSSLFYDIVKNTPKPFEIMNDWKVGGGWCDPLTVDSRRWFSFYNNKVFSFEEENVLHARQRYNV